MTDSIFAVFSKSSNSNAQFQEIVNEFFSLKSAREHLNRVYNNCKNNNTPCSFINSDKLLFDNTNYLFIKEFKNYSELDRYLGDAILML